MDVLDEFFLGFNGGEVELGFGFRLSFPPVVVRQDGTAVRGGAGVGE